MSNVLTTPSPTFFPSQRTSAPKSAACELCVARAISSSRVVSWPYVDTFKRLSLQLPPEESDRADAMSRHS